MKRNSLSILKNTILLIIMCSTFVIALSFFIVGPGGNIGKSDNKTVRNSYNQKISVYITKKGKTEDMNLEDYVTGVVSGEMPAEFSDEALKAQAVAARTFAAAHMEVYGGRKYNGNTGADVCDTAKCQVFMPKSERFEKWPESKRKMYWDKIKDAVDSTKGQVLAYNGKLVMEPYYFAVSSGRTESSLSVFNRDVKYLKSVKSFGDEKSKKYKTYKYIDKDQFIQKVNSSYKGANLSNSNLEDLVSIKSRNEGGSVKEIKLGGITISGIRFRSLMELNSSNFNIGFKGENVVIECLGYGHDVGMSQWGADALGKQGKDYKYILCHYYTGVKVESLSDVAKK